MESEESKWGPVKGIYIIDFNSTVNNQTNDIVNTKGAKFVFVSCEVSGAYTHKLIIDPPLKT